MKTRYLFPFKYKKIGWVLFLIGLIFGVISVINDFGAPQWKINVFALIGEGPGWKNVNESLSWSKNNIFDELTSVLIILGGLLVAFSRVKEEDEYISKIRMESLIWATYVNYGVLVLTIILVFGSPFIDVMIYNMFTILIFFIFRFHYLLYKTKKQLSDEE